MKKSDFALIFVNFGSFFESKGKIWFLLNLLSTISNFSLKTKIPKISFFRNHVWAHLSKTHWTFLYKTTTLASQSPENFIIPWKFSNFAFELLVTHSIYMYFFKNCPYAITFLTKVRIKQTLWEFTQSVYYLTTFSKIFFQKIDFWATTWS